jgi:uncharacterized pyridoxal phosphate-containing UPF0001 family protein
MWIKILELAVEAGQTAFGEIPCARIERKENFFEQHGCAVHFIGQLQTNKIKYVCGFAGWSSPSTALTLAQAMQQKAEVARDVQDILIQVNIGEEEQKGGVTDGDLDCFADQLRGSAT